MAATDSFHPRPHAQPRTTRRVFLGTLAGTGAALSSLARPQLAQTPSSSNEIRVGIIGVGIRGAPLAEGIQRSPGVRLAGVSDICDHYLDRIRLQLKDPRIPIHRDYRALLEDNSLHAVVIASPDHWHAQMTLEALEAGKDVYVEKPMTYSLEEAIQVRNKGRESGRVVQVGYQRRTVDHFYTAREIVRSGILGEITQIQLWSSRNRPTPPWRAYDNYNQEGLPEKSGPEHVDWERFQANRPPRPYDPRRFFHWQCYEEYSTGIFGILMSHPLDAANLVMDLGLPETCSATGGIYHYPDGRTVPDTCNALFNYPSRRLTISFIGSSNNQFFDQEAHYRGTQGTMELGVSRLRLYAEGKNALFDRYIPPEQANAFSNLRSTPVFEEPIHSNGSTLPHLDDFFACVRSRGVCKAPAEAGFKAMVTVAMAIESYRSQRSVRWDPEREQIIA